MQTTPHPLDHFVRLIIILLALRRNKINFTEIIAIIITKQAILHKRNVLTNLLEAANLKFAIFDPACSCLKLDPVSLGSVEDLWFCG